MDLFKAPVLFCRGSFNCCCSWCMVSVTGLVVISLEATRAVYSLSCSSITDWSKTSMDVHRVVSSWSCKVEWIITMDDLTAKSSCNIFLQLHN